jgi:ADP-heptose:LPS heptosyltransferase
MKKKSINIYTLQGLGNSINLVPFILNLYPNFQINLHLMENGSCDFYRDLDLNINVIPYKNLKDILNPFYRAPKSDYAISVCPNWRREIFSLWKDPSDTKICFKTNDKYTQLNPFQKIIQNYKKHDFENNIKFFSHLNIKYKEIDFLSLIFPEVIVKDKTISIHPTASTEQKFYPKKMWVDICTKYTELGYFVNIFSSDKKLEVDFCNSISENLPASNYKYFCNENFKLISRLIASSEIFIGLDSSLGHLAAILNTKVLSLWSFADYQRIYPYGKDVNVYLPHKIHETQKFEFQNDLPQKLMGVEGSNLLSIINNETEPSFHIKKLNGDTAHFYTF